MTRQTPTIHGSDTPPPSGQEPTSASRSARQPDAAGRGRLFRLGCVGCWLLLLGSMALSYRLDLQREQQRQAADEARALADDLIDFMLFQLRDQLEPIGRTELLERPARKALAYLDAIRQQDDAAVGRHRRSVALDNIGRLFMRTGDLPAAETAFRQALELAERLAREEPDDPDWQRGLAIALSRLGDVQQERGDLAGALAHHSRALDILDELGQEQPDDRERQYDVGLAHERLGAVLQARGELTEALKQYQARQIIASSLNTLDPDNTAWRRDLAISYGTIGDLFDAAGDSAGALAAYRKFAELAEQVAAQNPDNAEWQRDVAISQEKLGDLHAAGGDLAAAQAAYQRLAAISARLAALDPSAVQSQRDLAASRSRLAAVSARQGKLTEAADRQRQAAETLNALVNKPGTEASRRDAGHAWAKLAWYYLLQRQPEKALAAARSGANLAPAEPRIVLNLAHALLLSGRVSEAEKIYRENGKAILEGGRSWDRAVAEDFKTLIVRGIVHPEMTRIETGLRAGNTTR